MARHPLNSIHRIELTRRVELLAVFLVIGCWTGAAAVKLLLTASVWSWLLFGGLLVAGLICALGSLGTRLDVQSAHGSVQYNLLDPEDHSRGFVLTLQQQVEAAGPDRPSAGE